MRALLFLIATSLVAYADRVVVIAQTPELSSALRTTAQLEVVAEPPPAPAAF